MFAQLFGFMLFACQIIINGSSVIPKNQNSSYSIFSQDHAAYKIHEERATWFEARERCRSEGARLAIPDSFNEIEHITKMKNDWESMWIHVGMYRSNITKELWHRVDSGLNATSIPWAKNNPDDMGNCTGISLTEDGVIDYPCNYSTRYYVCEILI